MTSRRKVQAVIAAIALLTLPNVGWTQTFASAEEVLRDGDRVQIINRLSENDRNAVMQEVRRKWAESADLSLASLLCQVEPWSLGNVSADATFQQELMSDLPAATRPWSSEFAIRDCASANRDGSYFSVISDQQRKMRLAFVDGQGKRWIEDNAEIALSRIRMVDSALLRTTRGKTIRSFYPLLNVQHTAELFAARGVFLSESDPENAKSALLRAADLFAEWEGGRPAYFLQARNGFRYRNDIVFHKNFYRAVTGDTEALQALQAMIDWPALVDDTVLRQWVPPRILREPNVASGEYIDPIYFGRLLPGASENRDDEAYRWWQTSYDTRDVVERVLSCFQLPDTLSLHDRILRLDACIGEYDTEDWRVELASFRGRISERKRAEDELARLLDRLYRDSDAAGPIEQYSDAFDAYFENGRWMIRTEPEFSRAEILIFDSVLQQVRGLPPHRFFRRRTY